MFNNGSFKEILKYLNGVIFLHHHHDPVDFNEKKIMQQIPYSSFLLEWFFASPIAWLAKVQISDNFQTLQNADSMSPADLVCYWTAWLEPLLMFQNLSWQIKVTIHLNQDFPVSFFDILPMMYVVKVKEFSSICVVCYS